MNSKPLTYDSLKTVIQYMDPNTRILLSSRVPSIAKIEKLVPLRIKNLVIGFHNIRINETSYGYEIYQVDSTKNVPVKVSGINLLNHKLTCDVDEFGIRDYITKAGGMLPGNTGNQEANLFGEYDREVIPTDEGRLQKLERILETQKRYLLQCRHPNNILGSWNPNFREYESIEDWEEKIKMMEHELLPFQNRRNNIRPKFEIHVTKRQEDSPHQVIERVNYTGDLHKAEERIFQFMFSKRCSIQVNKLQINLGCSIRFPSEFKIMAKNLNFSGNEPSELDLLIPILVESSFPLEKLTISKPFSNSMNHEIIEKCKFLELEGLVELPLLQGLRNRRVHLEYQPTTFLICELFIVLIRSWIETNKPLGTCFTFDTHQPKRNSIQVLTFVKNRISEAVYQFGCIKIPMSNSTVLKISYRESEESDDDDYIIEMAVVAEK